MNLEKFGQLESAGGDKEFARFLFQVTNEFDELKKVESRVGTDEELKEADTLRYFTRESQAGKVSSVIFLNFLTNFKNFMIVMRSLINMRNFLCFLK